MCTMKKERYKMRKSMKFHKKISSKNEQVKRQPMFMARKTEYCQKSQLFPT